MNCPECKTALPTNWCGHDLAAIRDRAWQDGVNAANMKEDAELARLRAIEEAARALISTYGPYYEGDAAEVLRDALGSER